jgi:hypothetical protein
MSMTDTERSRRTDTDARGRTAETFGPQYARETKPSFTTTEFWAMLIGIAALIVVYLASDDPSFNLWRAAALCTALGVGYIVSRGFAKSASPARGSDNRFDANHRY